MALPAGHPLLTLAEQMHTDGGEGMEMRVRPLGLGLSIRMWLPSRPSADRCATVARDAGYTPLRPKLDPADRGWQLVVHVPPDHAGLALTDGVSIAAAEIPELPPTLVALT